jgi:two-component system cell cycle sensor histidine kinase/response regulator CckA
VGEVAEDADEGVAPEEESSQGRGETVLVVEDEPAILAMATRALSSFGYCVLAAGHPDEALATADGHDGPIDLLLTDVVMPGMNGQVLAERIKQARPDTRCLVMSGYAAEVLTPDGVLTPGLQFIQKPFSVVALADKVREVLDS